VHEKWIDLLKAARRGPVATRLPNVEPYLAYWLSEIVRPNLAPAAAN
jgi:hypothetical protein